MDYRERERLNQALHRVEAVLGSGYLEGIESLPPEPEAVDCSDISLLIVLPLAGNGGSHAPLSPGERELLSKMIQAIGFSLEEDCLLAEASGLPPFSGCPGPKGIIFVASEPKMGCTSGPGGVPLASIHHPRILLSRPELKRQSWENLKALSSAIEAGRGQ